jgi:hypothetical protein
LSVYSNKNPTIRFYVFLGVQFGLIFVHIIPGSFRFVPNNVPSSVIVVSIKAISVLIYPLVVSIFLEMSSLMNLFSR